MFPIVATAQIAQYLNVPASFIKEVRRFWKSFFVVFNAGHHRRPTFISLLVVIMQKAPSLADKMIVTKSAAARILGCDVKLIKNCYLLINGQVIVETVTGFCFPPKKDFNRAFVEERKARAKDYIAMPEDEPGEYYVVNYDRLMKEDGYRGYLTTLSPTYQHCECKDFEMQTIAFQGRGCCKHLYSVLFTQGIGSLELYIKRETEQ